MLSSRNVWGIYFTSFNIKKKKMSECFLLNLLIERWQVVIRYIITVSVAGQNVNSSNVQQQRLNAEPEGTKCPPTANRKVFSLMVLAALSGSAAILRASSAAHLNVLTRQRDEFGSSETGLKAAFQFKWIASVSFKFLNQFSVSAFVFKMSMFGVFLHHHS